MKRDPIACIDFDGTIVEHAFPEIGEPLPGAFEVLRDMQQAGWKLILWTCRENHERLISKRYLADAVAYCSENGVEFDAVNEAIAELDFRESGLRRKPYADQYIDDRNLGGFPGWDVVRELLLPVEVEP